MILAVFVFCVTKKVSAVNESSQKTFFQRLDAQI